MKYYQIREQRLKQAYKYDKLKKEIEDAKQQRNNKT